MSNFPWWHSVIIYQVYPMSFQDSNGDGVGDVKGIIGRLDYIQSLGANTIWMNPIFLSPKIDNGYDVANYEEIDPQFGTMEDVERLIEEAHYRGIRIVFDLVLNHTSNQHPWFQEALKGKDNPYRDYYIWKDGKNGGLKAPNNWQGYFREPVWEKEPNGDQYYFHLFAKEMPDLNWKNPEVRQALLDVACFWMGKGVDGFRLDAFIHIEKETGYPDVDLPEGEIGLAEQYYSNLPKVNTYMKQFTTELRERYPYVYILGEAASADVNLARSYCDPEEGGCNSVITFRYFTMDEDSKDPRLNSNLQKSSLLYSAFKDNMEEWQSVMADVGGPTLYWNNHDIPRAISRLGDSEIYRNNSAKMLATLMYLQKGIPIIYYGEEIGMKNLYMDDIEDFHAPEAKSFYEKALKLDYNKEWALYNLRESSKDASRGVMQWDDREFAGFSGTKPWSGVNLEPTYTVKSQVRNPFSVLSYYKDVLNLKRTDLFIYGTYKMMKTPNQLFVYERVWGNKSGLVVCNVTADHQEYYLPEVAPEGYRRIILENEGIKIEKGCVKLGPYGAVVLQTIYE
ncbi:alpha-glucosidase [Jeotgalibaca sp. MA1X17-3]|uniref:glycoside hydrolase family 13 protein n=1 Tax=Jeotgalibaca sp. MA1X17-3 TaxID=2908211 RepID=UPI001F183212|nr:alpha-glucosidase [Jeotgalibaca sp. MA1X17-3]UJF15214.1 alpha-glucosidase [Jeotgalibaca sp. MA1X17-3]